MLSAYSSNKKKPKQRKILANTLLAQYGIDFYDEACRTFRICINFLLGKPGQRKSLNHHLQKAVHPKSSK